jgi:hypothetical protein
MIYGVWLQVTRCLQSITGFTCHVESWCRSPRTQAGWALWYSTHYQQPVEPIHRFGGRLDSVRSCAPSSNQGPFIWGHLVRRRRPQLNGSAVSSHKVSSPGWHYTEFLKLLCRVVGLLWGRIHFEFRTKHSPSFADQLATESVCFETTLWATLYASCQTRHLRWSDASGIKSIGNIPITFRLAVVIRFGTACWPSIQRHSPNGTLDASNKNLVKLILTGSQACKKLEGYWEDCQIYESLDD